MKLPPGLTREHIGKAVAYIEKEAEELSDIYQEQRNVFSAIIGILGTRALDQFSVYEKVKHAFSAQQRFPDLKHRNVGNKADPNRFLESKGSKRPWAVQSHYDHEGWYVVWRYLVDESGTIASGKTVIVWRVDIVYLTKTDWEYEGSSAGAQGGGRTHTFGVKEPAKKLKDKAIYHRKDVKLTGGKPVPA